jgi:hypothetical protein
MLRQYPEMLAARLVVSPALFIRLQAGLVNLVVTYRHGTIAYDRLLIHKAFDADA